MRLGIQRRSVSVALAAFLVLRVCSTLGSVIAMTTMRVGPTIAVPGYRPHVYDGLLGIVVGSWLRSDTLWYLSIAESGYHQARSVAFFPAFPLLTRAVDAVVGNDLVAALIVSNLACAAGLVLVHALVTQLVDDRSADKATWAVALFPTSFFLVAGYAEPVAMAATAMFFLASLRSQYPAAALAGAGAALSRPFGMLLMIPAAWLAVRNRAAGRSWLPVAAIGAAIAGWAVFTASVMDDPAAIGSVQSQWQRQLSPFPVTVLKGIQMLGLYAGTEYLPYMAMDVAAVAIGIIVVTAAARDRQPAGSMRWPIAAYGAAAMVLPLSSMFPGRPLLSFPRFLLALAPLSFVAAKIGPRASIPLAVISGLLLIAAAALFVAARPLY